MKLFIRVVDGFPFEHPLVEDNVRQLFPEHDLETAPDGFAKFTRVERPRLGVYEKYDTTQGHDGCGCCYEPDGLGGFKDVWHVVSLSDTEKAEKMSEFTERCSEETCLPASFDDLNGIVLDIS
jgi:hypothetical protein